MADQIVSWGGIVSKGTSGMGITGSLGILNTNTSSSVLLDINGSANNSLTFISNPILPGGQQNGLKVNVSTAGYDNNGSNIAYNFQVGGTSYFTIANYGLATFAQSISTKSMLIQGNPSSTTSLIVYAQGASGNAIETGGSEGTVHLGSNTVNTKVNEILRITGKGTTSSTTALLVQNANASSTFSIKDNGDSTFFNPGITGYSLKISGSYSGNGASAIYETLGASGGYYGIHEFRIGTNTANAVRAMSIVYGGKVVIGNGSDTLLQFPKSNLFVDTNVINTFTSQSFNTGIIINPSGSLNTSFTASGIQFNFAANNSNDTNGGVFVGSQYNPATNGYDSDLVIYNSQHTAGSYVETARFVGKSRSLSLGAGRNPSASLHISGSSNSVLLEIDSPAVNNILYVSGSGAVGIGTSTTYGLQVANTSSLIVSATGIIAGYSTGSAAVSITPHIYATAGNRTYYSMYIGNPGITTSGSFGSYDFKSLVTAGGAVFNGGILAGDSRFYATSNAVSFQGYNPYNGQTGTAAGGITFTARQVEGSDEAGIGAYYGNGSRLYIYNKYNASDSKIIFSVGGTIRSSFFGTGNLSIGNGETDMSARLGVKGSGTTSSTTAFLVQNANATASFSVKDNGTTTVTGTDTPGLFTVNWGTSNSVTLGSNTANAPMINLGALSLTAHPGGSSLSIDPGYIDTTNTGTNTNRPITLAPCVMGNSTGNVILLSSGARTHASRHQPTSGVLNMVMVGGASANQYMDFAPSSGNAEFNSINIVQQINTSGSYSGIVRGLYYSPILTSTTGVIHRAIETAVGDVIINSGSVGIGIVSPSASLHVAGNTIITGSLTVTGSLILSGSNVSTAWTSYTPTWTSNGTQPVLGNGDLSGAYKVIGKTCFVRLRLALGSTSTGGTGHWLFSLPFTASNPDGIQFPCSMLDNGNAWYQGTVNGTYAGHTDKTAIIVASGGGASSSEGVTSTKPFVWGAADSLQFNGSYEIA